MKTNNIKSSNLSANQSALWDAVTGSHHSLRTISKRSGYAVQSIRYWMRGDYEPKQTAVDDIMQAIQLLKDETPVTVDWTKNKHRLIQMKRQGLATRRIAKELNTTMHSIYRAIDRYVREAA